MFYSHVDEDREYVGRWKDVLQYCSLIYAEENPA